MKTKLTLRQISTGSRRAVLLAFIGFLFLSVAPAIAPASAQTASPTPPILQPQPTPPFEAGNPSGQLSELLNHVRELVPYIRRQIERPMLTKFKTLATILGGLILVFSFIKTIRENDGASHELYYWFVRAVIFMAFFAMGPAIVSTLYKVGRTLTIPIESAIEDRRSAFNKTYYDFVHGTYIVRDDKQIDVKPLYLKPGEEGWIGVLTDGEVGTGKLKGLEQLEKSGDINSWHMDTLFLLLNLSRGILQAGEIFLLLLGGFIMVGLRLAAPFMIAVGIDKKLAERITYPFVWGVIVFTLIFPVVRDVLTYIAYSVGAFGLMLYKGEPIYNIDDTTGNIIKSASYYNPKMVIVISLVTMTISGLMLWLSPYIAYRISTGQVFEAVSSTASGWMAAIIGSAVEFAGLKAGASLQRQAENTQTQGSYQAEMTRAGGTLQVSNLGAQARKISSLASIEGGKQQALAGISGVAQMGRMQAMTMQNFTIAATRGQVGDSTRQVLARKDQNVNQYGFQFQNDSIRTAGEAYAKKEELTGQYAATIPVIGNIPATQMAGYANTDRTRTQNAANRNQMLESTWNEQKTAQTIVKSQTTYGSDIENAARDQYKGNVEAINTGEGIQKGGVVRGAAISAGGVNKAYGLEVQGNEIQFDTTIAAAKQIKEASFSAARMRELSTVISGVARDMDRRIEEGMRQHY